MTTIIELRENLIDNYSEIKDDLSHLVDDEDAYVEPDNRFILEYEVVWV